MKHTGLKTIDSCRMAAHRSTLQRNGTEQVQIDDSLGMRWPRYVTNNGYIYIYIYMSRIMAINIYIYVQTMPMGRQNIELNGPCSSMFPSYVDEPDPTVA